MNLYQFSFTPQALNEMTSSAFGDFIRTNKISLTQTFNTSYYGGYYADQQSSGTSHASILAPNGDAVAITGTINAR